MGRRFRKEGGLSNFEHDLAVAGRQAGLEYFRLSIFAVTHQNLVSTVQAGGGGVMVWGILSWYTVGR